jgi:hypothetical protein
VPNSTAPAGTFLPVLFAYKILDLNFWANNYRFAYRITEKSALTFCQGTEAI